MKKQYLAGLAVGVLLALGSGVPAYASLVVDGTGTMAGVAGSYRLIYDTDLNITWLDYTKEYAYWNAQQSWAADLVVTVDGVGYDNWRLPSAGPSPVSGYNLTTPDMGHLYYAELANTQISGLINKGSFANLVANYAYWSGTEAAAYGPDYAWAFGMPNGWQFVGGKSMYMRSALAVLPGRIQAAPVPEPASMLLIGSGLVGLTGLKRRKK